MIPSLSLWQPSYLVKCNSEICCVGVLKMLKTSLWASTQWDIQPSKAAYLALTSSIVFSKAPGGYVLRLYSRHRFFFLYLEWSGTKPIVNNLLLLTDQFGNWKHPPEIEDTVVDLAPISQRELDASPSAFWQLSLTVFQFQDWNGKTFLSFPPTNFERC